MMNAMTESAMTAQSSDVGMRLRPEAEAVDEHEGLFLRTAQLGACDLSIIELRRYR
jgi:hypothetical protein